MWRWQRVGAMRGSLPVCNSERMILMSCRQWRRTRVMTNMTKQKRGKRVREKTPDDCKNASHMQYNVKSCAIKRADGNLHCTQETPRNTQEHPGAPRSTQETPKRHPGDTQETPRRHPGGTHNFLLMLGVTLPRGRMRNQCQMVQCSNLTPLMGSRTSVPGTSRPAIGVKATKRTGSQKAPKSTAYRRRA